VKLYVDDVRPVPDGWRLARTVEEALLLLQSEIFEEVSLDYMIGHTPARTFAPVAHFIAQLPPERRPKKVFLHTSSPLGARELERILSGYVKAIIRA
jgi:uncharacterized membrane protein